MTQQRGIEMQVEGIASDVMQMLMNDQGMNLETAMTSFYKSRTFALLERAETGLYYQSPVYVYDVLCEEIEKKKDKSCNI